MSTLERLTLRCLMPGFIGTTVPEWVRRKTADGLGSVALYARNIHSPEQLRSLTDGLHAERPELVIAVDEEGGDVTRLEASTGSSFPGNLALGAVDDAALTEEVARAIGLALVHAGVDLDLAPDVDVNSNPLNPVIGVRSFGSDPALVARHTAAWVSGLQSTGVAACAKHFPGHGDTSVDSHVALPVVNEDPHVRALEPFRAAIAAGVRAVMSAHILVPALDRVPATISSSIMTGLLRDELGFTGVVVSDGLEMRGLSDAGSVPESAVAALAAGCDLLCIGGGLADEAIVDQIVDALVAAVASGRLDEERLHVAASRVDSLARQEQSQPWKVEEGIGLKAARRALRIYGDVRVGAETDVVHLNASPSMAAGAVPWGIADALSKRGVRVTGIDDADRKTLVIVVRDLHAHPEQLHRVNEMLAVRSHAILVEMGLPVCRPERARSYIATHGASRVSAEAAAEAMTA